MGCLPTSFRKAIEVSIYFYLSTCILKTVCYLHRQHADLVHQSLWLLDTHTHTQKVEEQA